MDEERIRNGIHIPRGTNYCISLTVKNENGNTHYDEDDVIKLNVKLDPEDTTACITKTASYSTDDECYYITLAPEDTAGLIQDERYWYDIGLQTYDGEFYMIVEASPFYVERAISKKVTT